MQLSKTLQVIAKQTGGRLEKRGSSLFCRGVNKSVAPTAVHYRNRNASLSRRQRLWSNDVNTYGTRSAASRPLETIRFQSSSKNLASSNHAIAKTTDKIESSTCLLTLPLGTQEVVNVGEVAQRLGVRLTECEKKLLQKKLDFDNDGIVTSADFTFASRNALEDRTMRELCLQVIEQPTTPVATLGTRFVKLMDYIGVALFSVVGTQVAGDAGFNLVGCTLVGCVAGLGGRSISNLLYGTSSPLLRQLPGVFWARKPFYLAIAIASSALTFFAWPIYCNAMSTHYLEKVIGRENLEADGSVGKDAFVRACEHNHEFLTIVRYAMLPTMKKGARKLDSITPDEIFRKLDVDVSGTIDANELKSLVQGRFHNSWEMYAIDTAALAAVTVAGVHGAISMGLHPLVAATSGIVMSLGGVLRDLFCGRDLAMASQSYAFATGAGSTVYVFTREMALRGYPLLAMTRIFLSMGTTVSIRCWEYFRGETLLAPMHGRK